MSYQSYKIEKPSERKLNLLDNSTDLSFHNYDIKTIDCLSLINEHIKIIEDDLFSNGDQLKFLLNFITQNYLHIDPTIFINSGFLSQIISYFTSPNLIILSIFDELYEALNKLTSNEMICVSILNDNRFDFMEMCAVLIANEPKIKRSEQYLNIMINVLPSFFKLEHEETDLFLDSISRSGAYLCVIEFIANIIYYAPEICRPKQYINILYGNLQNIKKVDETALNHIFLSFLCLINKYPSSITDNNYILNKKDNISIFEYAMKYFDIEDPEFDYLCNSKKVMEPLLEYIIYIFKYPSIEKLHFEELVFEFTGIPFFMNVVQRSQNFLIRKKALYCIYLAIFMESLSTYKDIDDFLKDPNLFPIFLDILKSGTFYDRYLSFLILLKKMQYASNITKIQIYEYDILDDAKDFIANETKKVLLFYYLLFKSMNKVNRGKEIAFRINELGIFDEVQNCLMDESSLLYDEDNSDILEILATLKNLVNSTLKKEIS